MANSGDWDSLDPARHLLRLLVELLPALRPDADHVQAGAGHGRPKLVPDLAQTLGGPATTPRPGRTSCARASSSRTAPRSRPRTSSTPSSAPWTRTRSQRPDLLQRLPRPGRATPARTRTPTRTSSVSRRSRRRTTSTIVFHLKQPFAGFDYLAKLPSTAPVPQAKDTGTKYKEHVVSTGPYKFESNAAGQAVRAGAQPQWEPATDPIRKPLPDQIEVSLNVNAEDIDNRLLAGDLDVEVDGTGVQPATQGRVLADPNLKKNADSAPHRCGTGSPSINADVAPLDNVDCRKAIEYGADHTGYQNAYGGPPRRRHRHEPAAAADPGCAEVRPYNFKLEADRRPGQGEGGAAGLRPAQRLRDQHLLPGRAPAGEGAGRVAAAVAGADRASS